MLINWPAEFVKNAFLFLSPAHYCLQKVDGPNFAESRKTGYDRKANH